MQPCFRSLGRLGLGLVFLLSLGIVHPAQAELLNLSSSLTLSSWSDITMSFGKATYNAATQELTILGTATAIDYDRSAPPDASILSGGPGNPASFAIKILVDNSGALVGGTGSPDLEVKGRITGGPHPTPVYGTLLTGEITNFGYANSAPHQLMEFVFNVTGGAQAPQFGTKVGVIFNSISGFNGSFANNFTTSSSGAADAMAVPEPATMALAGLGLVCLGAVRFRRPATR